MANMLEDIATNKISLNECLQRLLIIANKINNVGLSKWCLNELNGYNTNESLPEYRKYISRNLEYSGLKGTLQVKNAPLQAGFLSENTLKAIENLFFYESIVDVEKRKESNKPLYLDRTYLAGEVYQNTNDSIVGGMQCISIRQIISTEFYSKIYMEVKTRIINLLCTFENEGINVEKFDVQKIKNKHFDNEEMYSKIIVGGQAYISDNTSKKILWNVFIPIITGVCSAIIGGLLVYLVTNKWIN